MADETLRRNMDRAFDPGPDFPDRLLLSRTMASLDAADKIGGQGRERRGIAWPSLPIGLRMTAGLVAILLVVAVTAGAVLAIVLAHTHSAPARYPTPTPYSIPPPPAAKDGCSAHPREWASSPPAPAKMLSATLGWAYGPMLTTDGGATWHDVSPPSIPGRTLKNDEFFLDATHAWVAETAASAGRCVDHIVVFGTTDAGRTWQQAAPIPVRFSVPTDVIWTGGDNHAGWFDFIDAQHGWLLLGTGPVSGLGDASSWSGAQWRVGDLYRTTDGGLSWNLVATDPASAAGCIPAQLPGSGVGAAMSFSSATNGWIMANCPGPDRPRLLVTHDGGVSWGIQLLPIAPVGAPIFFDSGHGLIFADDGLLGVTTGALLVTTDGGASWTARASLPALVYAVDFITPSEGWAVGLGASPGSVECSPQNMDVCNGNFQLYRTRDGGKTWVPAGTSSLLEPAPKYWPPAYLHFVDSEIGFLDPGDVGFFRTSDGGRTWTAVNGTIEGP